MGDDIDEVRRQLCVKSLLQSSLLSAAGVE